MVDKKGFSFTCRQRSYNHCTQKLFVHEVVKMNSQHVNFFCVGELMKRGAVEGKPLDASAQTRTCVACTINLQIQLILVAPVKCTVTRTKYIVALSTDTVVKSM